MVPPPRQLESRPEARVWLQEICTEVTRQDLADFERWAVSWPSGVDADPVAINGIGFMHISLTESLVNPEGKLLGPEHDAAVREIEYSYALVLDNFRGHVGQLYRQARSEYFVREMFARKDLLQGQVLSGVVPTYRGSYNFSMNMDYGGWGVEIRFDSADFPSLEQLLLELGVIKRDRLEAVREYIAGVEAPIPGG